MRFSTASLSVIFAALLVVAGCGNGDESDDGNGDPVPDATMDAGDEMDADDEDPMDSGEEEDTRDEEDPDVEEDTGDEDPDVEEDTGGDDMDAGSDAGGDEDATSGDATDETDGDDMADATSDGGTMDSGDGTAASNTVQDLRAQAESLSEGDSLSQPYRVEDAVVTAVNTNKATGFFIQQQSGTTDNSGLWVYTGGDAADLPSRGDVVTVEGSVTNYGGVIEIEQPSTVNVTGTGSVPSAVSVTADEVMTGGSRADALEGVLVEVTNVEVLDGNPDSDAGDFQEFLVGPSGASDGVRVDDYVYDYPSDSIDPAQGDTFQSITGPLHYTHGNYKIVPRDGNDIVQ